MDTPISVLHLICVHNNTKADYTLLSREGQLHLPTFRYQVQVKHYIEEAFGQSKKKARHLAAKKMVLRLLDDPSIVITQDRATILECLKNTVDEPEPGVPNVSPHSEPTTTITAAANDDVIETSSLSVASISQSGDAPGSVSSCGGGGDAGNPIGKLQEICMKKHWHPPVYNELAITGLPHERMFTFECQIENMNLVISGSGKSKKAAKREAAEKMLRMLREENLDKVNEILDRIPKRSTFDRLQADGTFNLRNEIMAFQMDPQQRNERPTKMYGFYRELQQNKKLLEKIIEWIPQHELDEFCELYANGVIIPDVERLATMIAELIECQLLVVLHSEKSQTDQYQYWAEMISKKLNYQDLTVVSAWGADDDKNQAKIRALSRLVLFLLCMIQKDTN